MILLIFLSFTLHFREYLTIESNTSFVHISTDKTSIEFLTVNNLLGEILICTKQINVLDVSHLASGLYALTRVVDGQKKVLRFIKE